MRLALVCLLVVIASPTPAQAQRAPSRGPDAEVLALLRSTVRDSLTGGGRGAADRFIADDSVSLAELRRAGVRAGLPATFPTILCPGGMRPTVDSDPPVRGYRVRVRLEPAADSSGWSLRVTKSCTHLGGRHGGGFMHGGTWDIRRVDGAWRLQRTMFFIT